MLNKSNSRKSSVSKYVLVLPLLAIFLMSFNTKEIYLSESSVHKLHAVGDIEMVISKDFTDVDFEKAIKDFESNGVTLKFKGIKRNSKNEIIAIKIEASSKTSKANYNSSSGDAIKPITITYNSEKDSIYIGTGEKHTNHEDFTITTDDGTTKIVKSGSSSSEFVASDDANDSNNLVEVITKNSDGKKKETTVLVKRKTEVIHLDADDSDEKEKIFFITKDKDGKETKETITNSKDKQTWVVEEGGANDINIIKTKTTDNNLFISTDSESTLIFIDEKESTREALESLDPNNIESMNVTKGDKMLKKYGEKAKDGVIMVTTKK